MISLKLLFSFDIGKIFGVQVLGKKGVDKCIDVLVVVQCVGFIVNDFEYFEFIYVFFFNSVRDVVNQVGMVVVNVIKGDMVICYVSDVL